MKYILSLTAGLLMAMSANAVVVQKVQLKNGSVLEGYIQHQDKNDNIVFCSDNAIVNINEAGAQTPETAYSPTNLDARWIKWGEDNDAFIGTGTERRLILHDIIFNGNVNNIGNATDTTYVPDYAANLEDVFVKQHPRVYKVRVLEKGAKIKYMELTPNTYTFNWSDVESITSERRPKTALSGIDRVYQLSNGSQVSGQYAGEAYSTLSLYGANGVIETFDIDKVDRYQYKGINPAQSVFEQSELLDVVRTRNSGTYQGVIIERNFTEGNNYLVIQQQSGATQMLKFKDVVEYSKIENPAYNPLTDAILRPGELVINRMAVDTVGVTKKNGILILDKLNEKLSIPQTAVATRVNVEFYNPQNASTDNLIMVKLQSGKQKKKTVYGFSTDIYEMQKYVPTSQSTSVNHTTKLEYDLPGKGAYAIYDQANRKAISFVID